MIDSGIMELVIAGYISEEEVESLTEEQAYNLKIWQIRKLIIEGKLELGKAKDLSKTRVNNYVNLDDLIMENHITLEVIDGLTQEQIEKICFVQIQNLIMLGKLTLEIAKELSEHQVDLYSELADLICDDYITLEEVDNLTEQEEENLWNEEIRELIISNNLPIVIAKSLTEEKRKLYSGLSRLIRGGFLTLEGVELLNLEQKTNLMNRHIQDLVCRRKLSLERAKNLSEEQRNKLSNDRIVRLVENKVISVDKVLELPQYILNFLILDDIMQKLINKELTRDEAIKMAKEFFAPSINYEHSSVDMSVSDSASKTAVNLQRLYGEQLDSAEKLQAVLEEIANKMATRPDGLKNKSAKQCVEMIAWRRCGEYSDQISAVRNKELLALVYLVSKDEVRLGLTSEKAEDMLVDCLYEIQRSGNLDKDGNDDKKPSKPACVSGVFNRLAYVFQACHPAFEVRFSNKSLATLKLRAVIIAEARTYLAGLLESGNEDDTKKLQFIAARADDGVVIIYPEIRDTVANKMFEEFGALFVSKDSYDFREFIESGKYLHFDAPQALKKLHKTLSVTSPERVLECKARALYLINHGMFKSPLSIKADRLLGKVKIDCGHLYLLERELNETEFEDEDEIYALEERQGMIKEEIQKRYLDIKLLHPMLALRVPPIDAIYNSIKRKKQESAEGLRRERLRRRVESPGGGAGGGSSGGP